MPRDPVFLAYALTVVANALNLTVLWNLSGVARLGTRTTLNPEDANLSSRTAEVVASEPPAVSRVLRAHRNSFDNTIPFLLLALVFVLQRPDPLEAQILFGSFTAARVLYSITYLAGIQPWRTICYAIGGLATFVLMFEVCRLALAA